MLPEEGGICRTFDTGVLDVLPEFIDLMLQAVQGMAYQVCLCAQGKTLLDKAVAVHHDLVEVRVVAHTLDIRVSAFYSCPRDTVTICFSGGSDFSLPCLFA